MPRIVVPMFSPLEQLLSSPIFGDVPGKNHVGPVAQHQVLVDRHASCEQAVDLLQNAGRVEHDSASHHALHARGEDAARNERQFIGLPIADNGVSGVAPPLIAAPRRRVARSGCRRASPWLRLPTAVR